jgi:MYXO-CTERM domain-containing protein
MKRTLLAAALFVATAAQASFSGAFDPSNWTQSPGTGSIGPFSASSLSMTSGNDENPNGDPSDTDVSIVLASGGTVSFDWSYLTNDGDGPEWDPFFAGVMSAPVQLSNDLGANAQGGSFSFSGNLGDEIGFRMYTVDNSFGSATVTITNFCFRGPNDPDCASNPTPEPGGIALLGGALLAGLAARRRLTTSPATVTQGSARFRA